MSLFPPQDVVIHRLRRRGAVTIPAAYGRDMNGFLGADPVALRACARQLRTAARFLHAMLIAVQARIVALSWTGRDADAFRLRVRSALRRGEAVTQALDRLAAALQHQADTQDAVSAAESPAAPPISGGWFAGGVPQLPLPRMAPAAEDLPSLTHRSAANAETADVAVAAAFRRIPGLRVAQTLSAVLGLTDSLADGAHGLLAEHELEVLSPFLLPTDLGRAGLRFVVGEGSSFDRLRDGLEESVATTLDTKDSLVAAARDRDPWAAGAAVHEYTVRNLANSVTTFLPPAPAVLHGASEAIGAVEHDLAPILPQGVERRLDVAERVAGGAGDAMDADIATYLGAESWLRAEQRFLDRIG